MGILLRANLCFGVAVDEERIGSLPWNYNESEDDKRPNFEDWLKDVVGLMDPVPSEVNDITDYGEAEAAWERWIAVPANKRAWDDYSNAWRRFENECPIEVVPVYRADEDGSSACIIAVRSSVQSAPWQGGPNPLAVSFEISEEAIAAAREFCDKHNLPFDEPRWLVSVYR